MKLTKLISNYVWVVAALFSLSLVAIQPFARSQMLLSDDATLHLYRTVVLDHALRYDHPLYPRFSSALAFGYGAPLFHYFSPAAYYLPRMFHVLGMPFVNAWLAAMVVYLWLAMVGAFWFGKVLTSWRGGVAAAVAYVYAPYLLYDAVSRGTITEVAALAVLPFVLVSLALLAKKPTALRWFLATLSLVAFVPMHNIVTLHGAALIASYSLWLIATSRTPFKGFIAIAAVGIIGVGGTAFFWLPALGETNWIKLPFITAALPLLDVTNHLRDLSSVLAWPFAVDPQQQQAPLPITVSWVSLITAAIGTFVAVRVRRNQAQMAFWWAVVALTLFMNTPASEWLWRHVPLFHYTQFAWRILGITSVGLAALCAYSVYAIDLLMPQKWLRHSILSLFVVVSVVYAFPFTYRPAQDLGAVNVLSAQEHERHRGEVALSSYSEYLPVWASSDLDPNELAERWRTAAVIPRWLNTEGLHIHMEQWGGTSATLRLTADAPRPLTLAWLFMPQWWVQVNGTMITPYPNEDGLLTFDLPAGEARVEIYYGASPLQRAALAISLVALLSGGAVIVWWWRSADERLRLPAVTVPLWGVMIVVGVGVFAFKSLLVDHTNNLWHQRRWEGTSFDGQPIQGAVFNHELVLLASHATISGDGTAVAVETFWTARQPVARNYGLLYRLRDASGVEVARLTHHQPAGVDTSRWQVGLYVHDRASIPLPQGTLPGTYEVMVSVYDGQTLLPTINAAGNPDRPEAVVGGVNVPVPAPTGGGHSVAASLKLIAVEGLPAASADGEPFVLWLHWRAGTGAQQQDHVRLRWQATDGYSMTTAAVPLAPSFPPSQWVAGQTFRTPLSTHVPLLNASDRYQVFVEMVDARQQVIHPWAVGHVQVNSPARSFERPEVTHAVGAAWVNGMMLVGYDRSPSELRLVWQTQAQLMADLRIFVHLVGEGERIVAQRDEVPVNWTRPTTGWLPGEYLVSRYDFAEAALAAARVRVGVYDPITGERIPLRDGVDVVELPAPHE